MIEVSNMDFTDIDVHSSVESTLAHSYSAFKWEENLFNAYAVIKNL